MVAGREGLDVAGGGGGGGRGGKGEGGGGRVRSGLVNIGCIRWSGFSPSEVRSCRMELQPSDLEDITLPHHLPEESSGFLEFRK